MYLANRGFKVGNIPLVPGITLPEEIIAAPRPLFVGLTREPKSLSDIRQSRLRIMNLLLHGELCGCDIQYVLAAPQPNVSADSR
mgnify:CR=1 FL=1